MTKSQVLQVFSSSGGFITPDEVRRQLRPSPDQRSFYTYLLRLARQGLLARRYTGRSSLAYRLTDRGRERLYYLRRVR